MSQSPTDVTSVSSDHPYAQAANQLNRLVREGRSFSGHERNCSYLNVEGKNFANLSAVSGIDYPDDGRAIAASDWDFDGDLDFWVANRTGPQIRWMRNDLLNDNHFVALRLIGTTSNRDAVGATARLFLNGSDTPIHKSLRAGEGYLAQGSKWLHFGVGQQDAIERVEIRWPTGQVETVEDLQVDHFYTIDEGAGEAKRWQPPQIAAVEPIGGETPANHTDVTHHLLGSPAALPPLRYATQGKQTDATRTDGNPRLLNVWATWCRPCLAELKEFAERKKEIRDAGLEVVALSVDALAEDTQASQQRAIQMLENLDWPYASGQATAELLEILQLVNNMVYRDDHRRLPVPTSLLINGKGSLVAVYKGPVEVDRVLTDLRRSQRVLEAPDSVLPFAGRWIGLPGPHGLAKLTDQLFRAGLADEAVELSERIPLATGDDTRATDEKVKALRSVSNYLQRAEKPARAAHGWQQLLAARPANPDAHLELGALLAGQGNLPMAIHHFEQAAKHFDTPSLAVHLNLAQAYRQTGKLSQAQQEFQRALSLDPISATALSGLGLLHAGRAQYGAAAEKFRLAATAEPSNVQHRLNLGMAHLQMKQPDQALQAFQTALQIDPSSASAKVFSSEALTAMNRSREALDLLKQAVKDDPTAANVWFRLAQLAQQLGQFEEAVRCFRQLNGLVKDDPLIMGNLSWLLATVPDAKLRNADEAVQLAERAVEKTHRGNWQLLDALAAAYAEQGKSQQAVAAATEALELLDKEKQSALAAEIAARRAGYEKGVPFRVTPPKEASVPPG